MKFLFTGVMLLFSSEKLPAQSGVATQQIQISVPGNISIDNFIELSSGEKGSSENGRKYFNVKSNLNFLVNVSYSEKDVRSTPAIHTTMTTELVMVHCSCGTIRQFTRDPEPAKKGLNMVYTVAEP